MFGETIGQRSLANALDHASIPAESIAMLTPDVNTARALTTQLHGDTFRQQRAWYSRKPIDPDPSRTLENLMWEAISSSDSVNWMKCKNNTQWTATLIMNQTLNDNGRTAMACSSKPHDSTN